MSFNNNFFFCIHLKKINSLLYKFDKKIVRFGHSTCSSAHEMIDTLHFLSEKVRKSKNERLECK